LSVVFLKDQELAVFVLLISSSSSAKLTFTLSSSRFSLQLTLLSQAHVSLSSSSYSLKLKLLSSTPARLHLSHLCLLASCSYLNVIRNLSGGSLVRPALLYAYGYDSYAYGYRPSLLLLALANSRSPANNANGREQATCNKASSLQEQSRSSSKQTTMAAGELDIDHSSGQLTHSDIPMNPR
jgi:hypothetical protein